MCGILGLLAFEGLDPKLEPARQELMIFLGTEILQQTQSRGKDATGIVTLHRDGIYTGQKIGIPSADFIARFGGKKDDYEGYLKAWRKHPEPASLVLGHCRKSSVGNSWNNVNNHPIKVGEIFGVHNGTLTNHEAIFKNLDGKRDGTVDSEAIVRLVHHYTKNGKEPFTMEMFQEVTKRLHGTFACAFINGNNPYQVATFRDMRPMYYALVKPLKLVVIASDNAFLQNAFFKVNKWVHLYGNDKEWPKLNKNNIDLKELPDESIAIFNLTKEINDDTKVDDLYEWEKIPRTGKIWRTAIHTSTPASNGYATHQGTTTGNKVTNKKKAEVSGKPVSSGENSAFVYNKELKKYVRFNDEASDSTKEKGTTEIEVTSDKNNVNEVTKQEKSAFKGKGIAKEATSVEDRNKDDNIPVIEIDASDISDIEDQENVISYQEVDMTTDPEAAEIANEKADELNKFQTNKDVMIELEVANETDLGALQPHALANKVRKHAYRIGMYEGIIIGKEKAASKGSGLQMQKETDKKENQQKYIRQLKAMTSVLNTILSKMPSSKVKTDVLEKAVTEALDSKKDLDSGTLEDIFSRGDFQNLAIVRQVKEIVAAKENRK